MMTGGQKTNSVFRKDLVSGEWILVAPGRLRRPGSLDLKSGKRAYGPIENCPFEDPQKNNEAAVLWYPRPNIGESTDIKNWFVQVVPNKFPILEPHRICPEEFAVGPYKMMDGAGIHEVVITRDHARTIVDMGESEARLLLQAYIERYKKLKNENCVQYILIFHNHGPRAGASITHPHSQIIAMPAIPPDISRSLIGSRFYFEQAQKCVHCALLESEQVERSRIVYENDDFIALCPFAPRVSFEIRIYPKKHSACFEEIGALTLTHAADALRISLKKLHVVLDDPDYNFFIHTAPPRSSNGSHYHWHIEILPRLNIWAGVELGTGIDVVAVSPEESADALREVV